MRLNITSIGTSTASGSTPATMNSGVTARPVCGREARKSWADAGAGAASAATTARTARTARARVTGV